MTLEAPLAPQAPLPKEPVLTLRGISKNFGAVQALTAIDMDIYAGEVVAIVGDNGAGKSTLVKILAGVHGADAGTITFNGRRVSIPTPAASRALGLATVFQDLALCDNLDVVSNLFLGREVGGFRGRCCASSPRKSPPCEPPLPPSPAASVRRWPSRGH